MLLFPFVNKGFNKAFYPNITFRIKFNVKTSTLHSRWAGLPQCGDPVLNLRTSLVRESLRLAAGPCICICFHLVLSSVWRRNMAKTNVWSPQKTKDLSFSAYQHFLASVFRNASCGPQLGKRTQWIESRDTLHLISSDMWKVCIISHNPSRFSRLSHTEY